MKIAVTARNPGLDSEVDPRFGRAEYFLLIDSQTTEWQAVKNDALNATGGAGIAAAQTVIEAGAKAVMTGDCGPNAFRTLQAGGVQVYTGVSGTIRQVLEQFKTGTLQTVDQPSVDSHSGMGRQRWPSDGL